MLELTPNAQMLHQMLHMRNTKQHLSSIAIAFAITAVVSQLGCAAQPPAGQASYIKITHAIRLRGNTQPEPNLLYVRLGPKEALEVRRLARELSASTGSSYSDAGKVIFLRVAEGEIKKGGYCSGNVEIASEVDRLDKRPDLGVFVRCRPT